MLRKARPGREKFFYSPFSFLLIGTASPPHCPGSAPPLHPANARHRTRPHRLACFPSSSSIAAERNGGAPPTGGFVTGAGPFAPPEPPELEPGRSRRLYSIDCWSRSYIT